MSPIATELAELVEMFCEGDIEPQRAARLEALVAQSEESRQYFLDCFQVHCELAWELRDTADVGPSRTTGPIGVCGTSARRAFPKRAVQNCADPTGRQTAPWL